MAGHLVARQTIEITTRDRRQAEALLARTSRGAPVLAAAIETTLDALDPGAARVRFDRIVVDIGRCDVARWEEEIASGIVRGLRAAIGRAEPASGGDAATALALLAVFAASGRLPWWAGAHDSPAAAVATLAAERAEQAAVAALLAQPGAAARLAGHLDAASLGILVRLAAPGLAAAAGEVTTEVEAFAAGTPTPARVWEAVLEIAAAAGGADVPPALHAAGAPLAGERGALRDVVARHLGTMPPLAVISTERATGDRATASRATPVTALPGATRERGLRQGDPTIKPLLQAGPPEDDPADLSSKGLSTESGTTGQAAVPPPSPAVPFADPSPDSGSASSRHAAPEPAAAAEAGGPPKPRIGDPPQRTGAAQSDPRAIAAVAAVDPHDSVAVACAGLPLLWPFLPAFFRSVGLTDEDGGLPEPQRHRAAALLDHLATGERVADETRLVLPKLLAGLDPDALYQPGAPIDDPEAAATDALLAAVVDQAPAMSRAGPDGLRALFLVRPGLLTTRDGYWLLRVERRDYDLILDRLPWPIAWARLPWMPLPLRVEW